MGFLYDLQDVLIWHVYVFSFLIGRVLRRAGAREIQMWAADCADKQKNIYRGLPTEDLIFLLPCVQAPAGLAHGSVLQCLNRRQIFLTRQVFPKGLWRVHARASAVFYPAQTS